MDFIALVTIALNCNSIGEKFTFFHPIRYKACERLSGEILHDFKPYFPVNLLHKSVVTSMSICTPVAINIVIFNKFSHILNNQALATTHEPPSPQFQCCVGLGVLR